MCTVHVCLNGWFLRSAAIIHLSEAKDAFLQIIIEPLASPVYMATHKVQGIYTLPQKQLTGVPTHVDLNQYSHVPMHSNFT